MRAKAKWGEKKKKLEKRTAMLLLQTSLLNILPGVVHLKDPSHAIN